MIVDCKILHGAVTRISPVKSFRNLLKLCSRHTTGTAAADEPMPAQRSGNSPEHGPAARVPRLLSTLRRFRTIELKRLREIAAYAESASRDRQAVLEPSDLQRKVSNARELIGKIAEYDADVIEHPDLPSEETDQEAENYEQNRELGLRCIADLQACSRADGVRLNVSAAPRNVTLSNSQLTPAHDEPDPNSPSTVLQSSSEPVQHPPENRVRCYADSQICTDVSPEPFDGDRLQFRSFMAQFRNWIDRRKGLTSLDKLIVLRKHLRGEAKTLIDSLQITEGNYEIAIGLLQQAFGQVEIERQQIMAMLFNLPRVKSQADTTGLRGLLNIVQSSIQRMQALGAPLSEYALALEPVLHSSVPPNLIFDFTEAVSRSSAFDTDRTRYSPSNASASSALSAQAADGITALVDYLRRYTSHREQTALILNRHPSSSESNKSSEPQTNKTFSRKQGPPAPRTGFATVSAVAKTATKARKCFFCRAVDHKPSQCTAELSTKQRMEALGKAKRCQRCFRFSHDDSTKCPGPREACARCSSHDHYTVMHPEGKRSTNAAVAAIELSHEPGHNVLLHTASAYVIDGAQRIPVRLFLDNGSSLTFVSSRLTNLLTDHRPISSARLGITTFSGEKSLHSNCYQLRLQSTHSPVRVNINAYEYDFSVDPLPNCSDKDREIIKRFAVGHPLADAAFTSGSAVPPVSLLIGRDQYFKIAQVGVEETLEGSLVARGSVLGWIVGGTTEVVGEPRPELVRANVHCCVASVSRSARDLERLWELEAIGIEKDSHSPLSSDELSATQQFSENLKYDGKSYTVAMPRRPGIEALQNNFRQALDRLRSKLKLLGRQPDRYARYHQEVMSFVDQGHAEEVTGLPLEANPGQTATLPDCYFMPHHNVVTQSGRGEKWRVVFDCSSAARGCQSLNSYLLAGPNLNPDIVGVLLNFRLHPIAVSADIARAYLCINIYTSDRPLFRFLWRGPEDSSIRCYQMRKVTWGATPSGYLLAATLREHFLRLDPDSSMRLGASFYHDDFLRSFTSVSEAQQFVDGLQTHLRSAGMELAKWKTSSRELADHLQRRGVPEAAVNLETGKLLKILGISWHPAEDTFHFALEHVIEQARSGNIGTKRLTLKLVASIYDPLGWLAPYLIRGKLCLRALWAEDLQWDDPLGDGLASQVNRWTCEVSDLAKIRIPRCIGTRSAPVTVRHLHLFGDASPLAYAAVAYLQTFFADGSSETSILMSKTRVAPRQQLTLPRLELMAALLCVRLQIYVVGQLAVELDRIFFYTDSMVTYYWCTSAASGRWKQFIANRLTEIQASSLPDQWFHIPGPLNPADLATRGISAEELCSSRAWWAGPDWVSLPESDRPTTQPGRSSPPSFESVLSEMRSTASVAPVAAAPRRSVVAVDRYSTLARAVGVTSQLFRFLRLLRKQPNLEIDEARSEALSYLIRCTQREYFPQEVTSAITEDPVPRKSVLAGFKLFTGDDNLLRVRTRLRSSPFFTEGEKNPIIVPGNSHLAALIIADEHRKNAHLGVSTVLASLRARYWITRGRQRVKSIIGKCVACRKQHGPALRVEEGPLPDSRLGPVISFQTSGLDFCGPFRTRRGKDVEKSYIALFTCTTVRAVHLELVPAMSAVQTHLAIRRFLSLHPDCVALISDNARSFEKAAADFRRLSGSARDPAVQQLLSERGLKWKFNCPRAPWHGGFFERLVGTVKGALKRTLGRSLLTFEELRTVVSELAAAVNARPLTYVSSDPNEFTPLTSAHFLRGAPRHTPLTTITPLDELGKKELRSKLLERTTYYRSLEARWKEEYLTQLRTANRTAPGGGPLIKAGDVCLLKDEGRPRGKWSLVRIEDAHPGRDELVRSYTVKFENGYVSRRAAQLLCPLEVV